MMKIFSLLFLIFISISSFAQDEKYFIHQNEVVRSGEGIVRYTNKKSYYSFAKIKIGVNEVTLETDSLKLHYFILRKFTRSKFVGYYVAKYDKVYFLRTFVYENHYYLILTPVKLFTQKRIGGEGIGLTITTNKTYKTFDPGSEQIQTSIVKR